jgi:hypothetical protein
MYQNVLKNDHKNSAACEKIKSPRKKIYFFNFFFYSCSDASLAEILFLYDTQSNTLAPFR